MVNHDCEPFFCYSQSCLGDRLPAQAGLMVGHVEGLLSQIK
jgi:hypothetical protein